MLQHAFKEWAVICKALAVGRQALILRKGGIAENSGSFRLEHTRFWLFPTYVHQQQAGITPEASALLEEARVLRPTEGILRLEHFVEVDGSYLLHDMVGVLRLAPFHIWSMETVHARFRYRQPGILALVVRVFRAPNVFELPDLPAYAGCHSWVKLERGLPTEGATPVLAEGEFEEISRNIERALQPTALT
jgi:hypothetical protein